MSYPNGSIAWYDLAKFASQQLRYHGLPERLEPKLGKSWRKKIGNRRYPELWLKYYATLRHFHGCMVLASDYANHMTDEHLPIVRDEELDRQLLWAHALLVRQTGERRVNGQRRCLI